MRRLLDAAKALLRAATDMHPGDDLFEVMGGHHCCEGKCWHRTRQPPTCNCYGLGSSHAADCPAWKNGRAEEEKKRYG